MRPFLLLSASIFFIVCFVSIADGQITEGKVANLNESMKDFYCVQVVDPTHAIIKATAYRHDRIRNTSIPFRVEYYYEGDTTGWIDKQKITTDRQVIAAGTETFTTVLGGTRTLQKLRDATKKEIEANEQMWANRKTEREKLASDLEREVRAAALKYAEIQLDSKFRVRLTNDQIACRGKLLGFTPTGHYSMWSARGTTRYSSLAIPDPTTEFGSQNMERTYAIFKEKDDFWMVRIADMHATTQKKVKKLYPKHFDVQTATGIPLYATLLIRENGSPQGLPFRPKKFDKKRKRKIDPVESVEVLTTQVAK